ncbi:hypothetical protein ABZ252_00665 [Streptomyces sp. NPDC006175]|uniref:hypothetical protein n=1 Tax=Streptomyces sp. NPDC006175 TaxID=3154471 RepID=UPI0033BCAF16
MSELTEVDGEGETCSRVPRRGIAEIRVKGQCDDRAGEPGPHLAVPERTHINRFGEYSTRELGIQPEAYDPMLDVNFTPLREQDRGRTRHGCLSRLPLEVSIMEAEDSTRAELQSSQSEPKSRHGMILVR